MNIGYSENVNIPHTERTDCATRYPSTDSRTKLGMETEKLTTENKNHNTAAKQRSRQKLIERGLGPLKVIAPFFLTTAQHGLELECIPVSTQYIVCQSVAFYSVCKVTDHALTIAMATIAGYNLRKFQMTYMKRRFPMKTFQEYFSGQTDKSQLLYRIHHDSNRRHQYNNTSHRR